MMMLTMMMVIRWSDEARQGARAGLAAPRLPAWTQVTGVVIDGDGNEDGGGELLKDRYQLFGYCCFYLVSNQYLFRIGLTSLPPVTLGLIIMQVHHHHHYTNLGYYNV